MKKIFLTVVFTLVSILSFGQDLNKITHSKLMSDAVNNWVYFTINGDELKGTLKSECFTYISVLNNTSYYTVQFVRNEYKTELFITSSNGIFDYNNDKKVFGRCGFYDENDNLIECLCGIKMPQISKIFVYNVLENGSRLEVEETYGKNWEENIQKRLQIINKIFNYLMNNNGYVRFIAPKYNGEDMDIKIQCLNNK